MDSLFWVQSLSPNRSAKRNRQAWVRRILMVIVMAFVLAVVLAGCGGGSSSSSAAAGSTPVGPDVLTTDAPTSVLDATRLGDQASFGNTEALQAEIASQGPTKWVAQQMKQDVSRYTRGGAGGERIHTYTGNDFCVDLAIGNECWRDFYSSEPLNSDFYRNAVNNPDQLRQRVALALSQILVTSEVEVNGTYGLREYQNIFLANAFGNYRTILEKVTLSPLMGDYLNNANNDKNSPNENYARELLQLFSVGTCLLQPDGTLQGGKCTPTYDNVRVRDYAYALTGWTYPAGGDSQYKPCWPTAANCRFYRGDMVPRANAHDNKARTLLGGYSLQASRTAPQALAVVLDSLMNHPNTPPFIGRQIIQHLTTSNPSPAYVGRVANAFATGRFGPFGGGVRGDMAATVAAVLLDAEARTESPAANFARLREPIQVFTGTLRAMNGRTDGQALSWKGDDLRQQVFRAPSVFNFYPPTYPVAGTALVGPQFGILNANTGMARVNFVNYLVFWEGSNPDTNYPDPIGTKVNLVPFEADATDPAKLVDRFVKLALGGRITAASRQAIISAVSALPATGTNAKRDRVRTAAYLVYASPQYHVTR